VRRALTAPLRLIALNAGLEGGGVLAEVASRPAGHGPDTSTGKYVDTIAAIDRSELT
jgi:chaperonin GroEL